MRRVKYIFGVLGLLLFAFGCTKSVHKNVITNQTYFIEAHNSTPDKNSFLTIKTSLQREKTFTFLPDSTMRFDILAAPGEYVTFTVPTGVLCTYRVLDSKEVVIASYSSALTSPNPSTELDFIAFPPEDPEKDFMKYKTGLAKEIGDHLIGSSYLLSERYILEEDGVKTDNAWVQEACSFNDEYQFLPYRGENGNFNPDRLGFAPFIDRNISSCSYGPGLVIPTNNISVVTNGNNQVMFPIWDKLSVDAAVSMVYRQLTIDSISTVGVLTMHRMVEGEKEVFVYKPK